MNLYLSGKEEHIHFPLIKEYFKEIVGSYDMGYYRSAMVMLYSTIVCDLLLKLKELSEVYADSKAETLLSEINGQRKNASNSQWEWNLIDRVHRETELINDEDFKMIFHIYDLRNFSAHPALNEEYELISPSAELTVAYIKKALDDIFSKPSIFAGNIVDRMSDDIASKKDIFQKNYDDFKRYLDKAYFQRMSEKMMNQVFKAFWKFTFVKVEGKNFKDNRLINRKTIQIILDNNCDSICKYIKSNQQYFSVAQDEMCLKHLCVLLAYYPQVYGVIDNQARQQVEEFDSSDINLLKWFTVGDLEEYVENGCVENNVIPEKTLTLFKSICEQQGVSSVFYTFLIEHYKKSNSYTEAKLRFSNVIRPFLQDFNEEQFIKLLSVISSNPQIYKYMGQPSRNNEIVEYAGKVLPANFDYSQYPNFIFTQKESDDEGTEMLFDEASIEEEDGELPF